jgi:subtilisin family serine protease
LRRARRVGIERFWLAMTKFLVLRSNVGDSSYLPSALGAVQEEEEWQVQTVDGHDSDVAELRKDSKNRVVVDADILLASIAPRSETTDGASGLSRVGALHLTPGLLAIGAHSTPFSGAGVTVAVLDTGIDAAHPVFAKQQIIARNFTTEGGPNDCFDTAGHGTHCAATLCGAPHEDIRVGVAPGVARLCVGKVVGSRGATAESLLKGLLWAVIENRADVVSLSLSFDLPGNTRRLVQRGMTTEQAANAVLRQQADLIRSVSTLRAFLESQVPHVIIVAASGNESRRPHFALDAGLPAAELFAVGAVGPDSSGEGWAVAPFSNGRARVVAPGMSILSAAAGGGWKSMSGTSMATPHVAGVAALWAEKARREGALAFPGTVTSWIVGNAERGSINDPDLNAIGNGMARAPQA